MLRLTRTAFDSSDIVLKAEGQIVGDWVALLASECRELLATKRRVALDLSDVSYLDRGAVRVLRELTRDSLSLVKCPPLIEELLTEDGLE